MVILRIISAQGCFVLRDRSSLLKQNHHAKPTEDEAGDESEDGHSSGS